MQKKLLRRILFLLGAVLMISCGSLVYAGTIESSGTCGENATWTLDSEGVLTISGTGEMNAFDSAFRPYKVKKAIIEDGIKSVYLKGCFNMTEVEIPDSVTFFGMYAFSGCSSLPSITVSDNITSIGMYAFEGCSSLTSITIPDNLITIANSMFEGCSGLRTVVIPNSVTTIGTSAFKGCSSLSSIIIPDSVTTIGTHAFYGCSGIISITIPDSVNEINGAAFFGCSSLTSINIPNGVTSISISAFNGCSSLSSIVIPDNISTIGSRAFENCTALTSLTIPESVSSIGSSAFWGCSNLSTIIIPDSVSSMGGMMFYDCKKVIVYGNANSYAHTYAKEANIKFQCLSHKTIINASAVEPSCFKEGYTAGKKCADCDFPFEGCEPIPAEHKWQGVPCRGLTCSICGTLGGVKAHVRGNPATCTEPQICTGCGIILVAAKGHSYGSSYICYDCGFVNESLKPAPEVTPTPGTGGSTDGGTTPTPPPTPSIGESGGGTTPTPTPGTGESGETVTPAPTPAPTPTPTPTPEKVTIGKVTLSASSYVYNGKVKSPKVIVRDTKGNILKKNVAYTVTTPKGRKAIGKYTYTIKFKGDFAGTKAKKLTLTIKPKTPTITAPKAAKKAVTVKWKKGKKAQVTGYQIMTATNSKFTKNAKTTIVKGYKVTSKKVTKLKAKTKYFVKVRAYKTVKGVQIYSDWSKAKTCRTK